MSKKKLDPRVERFLELILEIRRDQARRKPALAESKT